MKYFVTLLGLVFVIFTHYSQEINKKYHLKHNIKQDNQQYEFKVVDFDFKGVKNYHKNKTYYWLKSQQIIATQGSSSGLLLHGEFQAFYPSKQLAKKGTYRYGLKHGEWIYWNEKGQIMQIEHWNNGIKCGTEELYDDSGKLLFKSEVSKRKMCYAYPDSIVAIKPGRNIKTITFIDKKQQYTQTVKTKNGRLHGKQIQYQDGKAIKKEWFRNGEKL